ncbi:MAG TPA: Rrf2 family transcriptional regulator [Bacteroidales bacterium]|nr:Rrf2 family transcriptional regulator [Bacteroidales bacterium]
MLSKKVQYAIVALTRLAKEYNKGPILISDIAKQQTIPKKFLENILLDLKNSGYLGSKKGKGGGYYLIKHPSEINIADIIRLFDGAIALLPCATFKYYQACPFHKDESTCGFRNIIKEVRNQSVNILKNNSLADILRIEEELKNKKK